MRKISATYIFQGNQPPLKNGILICSGDGTILDLIDTGGNLKEQAGLEYYSGILVPGFVNAHCHLELSHLKEKIPEKTRLASFLSHISRLRNADAEVVEEAIRKADIQMQNAGIVAVGDVSNSIATLTVKKNSNIYYHTFSEAFGFHPSRAEKAFLYATLVEQAFKNSGLPVSVTPHASYSVSEDLLRRIMAKAYTERSILSFHFLESKAEESFYKSCSGPILHHLRNTLGLAVAERKPSKIRMLAYYLSFIPKENQLLLVHNTFTTAKDIKIIKTDRNRNNTYFVICPNSNLFIENQMPPLLLFIRNGLKICIGTDSLASNHQLSVLNEMLTIQNYYPEIPLQELVEWACINGASALNAADRFGSFEKGKKPGINLITGLDLQQLKLTSSSRIKVLQPAL